MCTPTKFDVDVFRVLLYQNNATELLLGRSEGGYRLPEIAIPVHTRTAEEITAAIRKTWNLETYCLFSLPHDSSSEALRYQVVEACRLDAIGATRMRWLPVRSLSFDSFACPSDFSAIQESLKSFDQYHRNELPGVFGKPGWLQTVTDWVAAQGYEAGLRLSGKFRQLNASPSFSLIRFETDGPALWFKAVGEPNLREYPITLTLSKCFPALLPSILAARADWNGWLAIEAPGAHPDEHSGIPVWTIVAATLADLQLASLGHSLHLLDSGCRDRRAFQIEEQIEPFLDFVAGLMAHQTPASPTALSREQLHTLATQIKEAFRILKDSGLPDALGHMDISPSNLVVQGESCIFIDWAEAFVGHPFLTLFYLLEHLRRIAQRSRVLEKDVVNAYVAKWRLFFNRETLSGALNVAPLLAAFTYAVSLEGWKEPSCPLRDETAKFLRSMTRRMKIEAEALMARGISCAL
jgi:Phosphotransferase enzyme family